MGQADVSTTITFSVGLGNQCWPRQTFPLNKRAHGNPTAHEFVTRFALPY